MDDLLKKESQYKKKVSGIKGWTAITEAGLDSLGNRMNANANVIEGKILSGTITEDMLKLRPKYVYDSSGVIIGTVDFKFSNAIKV